MFIFIILVDNGKVPLGGKRGGICCEQNTLNLVIDSQDGAAMECIRDMAIACKHYPPVV